MHQFYFAAATTAQASAGDRSALAIGAAVLVFVFGVLTSLGRSRAARS
jgi:hypothetical protein